MFTVFTTSVSGLLCPVTISSGLSFKSHPQGYFEISALKRDSYFSQIQNKGS